MCRWALFACPVVMLACAPTAEPDPCQGVVCNQPPADECRDGNAALHFPVVGQCRSQTGQCEYGATEEACPYGCSAGRCLDEDKCRGVVCDQPPPNECSDTARLKIYEAIGNCVPDTGQCGYIVREIDCLYGCLGGLCQNQDLCQAVTCDDPPDDACLDGTTLKIYDATGTCNPDDGRCQYGSREQVCDRTCQNGRCADDRVVWGYVGIIESSDIPCYETYYEWCDPVRAYFATDSCHTLVLPHHLDALCTMVEKQTLGSCTLYSNCDKGAEGSKLSCAGGCASNQECVGWYCKDLPPTWDMGIITIEGLLFPASMSPDPNGRYAVTDPPADLFNAGDPITLQTNGGEFQPLSLSANGVADLQIASPEVLLEARKAAVIRWTPADPGSQVQVVLYAGWHFPLTPYLAIVCEAPDDAGQIQVPAAFVDQMKEMFLFMRYSRITRFTRQVITPYQKPIELFVGQARLLTINNL